MATQTTATKTKAARVTNPHALAKLVGERIPREIADPKKAFTVEQLDRLLAALRDTGDFVEFKIAKLKARAAEATKGN